MVAERGRKKKLTVAFHFLRGGQAGWTCEQCRRQALESSRRCGWIAEEARGPTRVVWARGHAWSEECPKSLVTPRSEELVERFVLWKMSGGADLLAREAKEADAFLTLEKEWREMANGESF